MRLFPASLRWRTLIAIVVALVLSQATALWLFDEHITKPRLAIAIGQFVNHLKTINAALRTMTPREQDEFIARIAEKEGIRIMTVRGNERMRPAPDVAPLRVFRERLKDIFGPDTEVYVRAGGIGAEGRPDLTRDGRPRVLWVKLPAGERDFWISIPRGRVERDTATALIAWSLAGLAIAILATFLLVWRLNRPLGELARAAASLGRGGDPHPVAESGPSEIRAVARAFNQMKEDLARKERERATFLAGISHDLRTPLARLRLDVEMLDGKVDPAVQRGMVCDVEDMNAIIDQFTDFARSEATEPLAPVSLADIARATAERAARNGANVLCDPAEVPQLLLRPLAMRRLADNLVANALKHGGGEVLIRTAQTPDAVVLSVLDRGPGIPREMVERLKQPFARRDEARSGQSGAGLGLAIADRIATMHGGRLELLTRDGGGLEARLTLPRSQMT